MTVPDWFPNSSSLVLQDMCGGPAAGEGWLDPGSLHRAVLTGLAPDTEYFYIFGDEVGFAFSVT